MKDTTLLTLPAFFHATCDRFGDRDALALVGEKPLTYREVRQRIYATMNLLERLGIGPGDRVAILSTNQPQWAVAYFAITFMGAVAVPLLPDFLPAEIGSLLEHSGTRAICVSEGLMPKVSEISGPATRTVIRIEDFSLAGDKQVPGGFQPESQPLTDYHVKEEDLATIIYTSGTTGKPKGVMLTHRNICFSATTGFAIQKIEETDRFLSILPLSHAYENTLGLILPVYAGASVFYLGKAPTPALLIPALQQVKPTTMLTVPLIMEKIFRTKILPALTGNRVMKGLYQVPVFRKVLHRAAGRKLMVTFGGQLRFFGIGGAKLDRTVEQFLLDSHFPYAIGYGLTECAPLLAGFNPHNPTLQSTGPACQGVELKIVNPDNITGEGEIWARGPNIMQGYYREPAITQETITPDGWLKTGDLGTFDRSGNLYIRGRVKSMIVRANGENIYPEDIESVINNFRHVVESLVVEKKGKLVALVHFNQEEIEQRYHHLQKEVSDFVAQKTEELRRELQDYVNARVNKFSQVQSIVAHPVPFDKTATQKIKRFMYT